MNVDPTLAFYVAMVSLVLSGFNTWLLWRKGAVTRDDVIMMLKVMMALIPFTDNPMFKVIFNDIIHAFMDRFRMHKNIVDIEEVMKRAFERVVQMQQEGLQVPQQAPKQVPDKVTDKKA